MKKIIIGYCVLCFFAVQVSAQIPTFTKGDNVAGAAIGFGGNIYPGSTYTNIFPVLSLNYEHCILDHLWDKYSSLGIGGMIGYTSAKEEYKLFGTQFSYQYNNFIIGAKGTIHYAFVDKLDTYAGLMLGYNFVSYKAKGSHEKDVNYKPSDNAPAFYFFAGARYYLTDTFAAFAELGYGVTIVNAGISIKF